MGPLTQRMRTYIIKVNSSEKLNDLTYYYLLDIKKKPGFNNIIKKYLFLFNN